MLKTIGIIGFGQMGKIFFDIFSKRFKVVIFNRNPMPKKHNIAKSKLKDACSSDLVIFCVPTEYLKKSLRQASNFLKKGTVVLDISSVKEKPSLWMIETLPKFVEILCTHPMFGPNSINLSNNKNIVFCPVRIKNEKLLEVEKVFKDEKFTIFKMSPKEHDQKIAKSQVFLHLIAQVAKNLQIKDFPFAPTSFKLLLKAFNIADPSTNLLKSMVSENRFGKQLFIALKKELSKLEKQLLLS